MVLNFFNNFALKFLLFCCVIGLSLAQAQNEKFLRSFIGYMNNLPNQAYVYEDGIIVSTQNTAENLYNIGVSLKVRLKDEPEVHKLFKCTATLEDQETGIIIRDNAYECHEDNGHDSTNQDQKEVLDEVIEETTPDATEPAIQEQPIKLYNEVQSNTEATSGEQFVAIPRRSSGSCIGCSTLVDTTAPGVLELSLLAVRHLNKHEPNVVHTLKKTIEVERQVQVINGVRYTLILEIAYNNCSGADTNNCIDIKICKIAIREKPWINTPSGAKYRTIMSNNCTEEWLYGDDGESLDSNIHRPGDNSNGSNTEEVFKVILNTDVQALPTQEKHLTDEEIKNIQEQIIPNDTQIEVVTLANSFQKQAREKESEYLISETQNQYNVNAMLSDDKKKAIDALMDIFDNVSFTSSSIPTSQIKQKRQVVGGITVENPNDPKYKVLAEESLDKYLRSYGITIPHRILKIEQVSKQVVSGFITRILFTMSAVGSADVNQCHSEIWERQWMKSKEITVQCEPQRRRKRQIVEEINYDLDDENNVLDNIISDLTSQDEPTHRFIVRNIKQKEGEKWITSYDGNLRELATEALRQFLNNTGINVTHVVSKIYRVTSHRAPCDWQSKLCSNYTKIKFAAMPVSSNDEDKVSQIRPTPVTCHTAVWEKTWLTSVEYLVTCNITKATVHRFRRSQFEMIGVEIEQDPHDPQYKELARQSLKKFLVDNDVEENHRVVSVDHATTQVMPGTLTRLRFTAERSKGDSGPFQCISAVWVRPWLNDKHITVSCDYRPKKPPVLQPLEELEYQNPKQPEFFILAQESLSEYIKKHQISEKYSVASVVEVTKQAVKGVIYRLIFTARIAGGGNLYQCFSEVLERHWLNERQISVDCDFVQRKKRNITGGLLEQDPKQPDFATLAEESLSKYMNSSGVTEKHSVVSVDKVTTQVVSGVIYRLNFTAAKAGGGNPYKCSSEVWDRSWLNDKQITVNCDFDQRIKRDITGGLSEQDPKNPEFATLAEESLSKYMNSSGVTEKHSVVSVDKVTTQVVSGFIYRLNFTAAKASSGNPYKCYSEVWDRPWLKSKDIKVVCDLNQRNKRHVVTEFKAGSVSKFEEQLVKDPHEPKYKSYAERSLKEYLATAGISGEHKVVSVDFVTSRIIAGLSYRINFTAAPVDGGEAYKCHLEVWERGWLDRNDITAVGCNYGKTTKRESFPGGISEQSLNDKGYISLAEESLKNFLISNGINDEHIVLSVEEASSQVVNGLITRLKFTAAPASGGDSYQCHSEVLEHAWLKVKEITVDCKYIKRNKRKHRPGRKMQQDLENPAYKTLAEKSLNQYLSLNNITEKYYLISVDEVSSQVVTGIKTSLKFTAARVGGGKLLDCSSEIVERAWLNAMEIKVDCVIGGANQIVISDIPGGIKHQDPITSAYKPLAEECLQKYLKENGFEEEHKVVLVQEASTEVVSGIITRLKFKAAPRSGGSTYECNAKVLEQAWRNVKNITVDCSYGKRERHKREESNESLRSNQTQVPGGESKQDPNDPKYKSFAEESLSHYLNTIGVQEKYKVVQVDHVVSQVVAGTLTKLNFTVVPVNGNIEFKCYSEVWERLWLDLKDIAATCENTRKPQRSILIKEAILDPDHPKFMTLAKKSLKKFLTSNGLPRNHKVISVDSLLSRSDEGILYRINFTASPEYGNDNDNYKCYSEVLEKQWLYSTEISVKCDYSKYDAGIDPQNPQFRSFAEEAYKKYLDLTSSNQGHIVKSVDDVASEVVTTGIVYRINFTVFDPPGTFLPYKCHTIVRINKKTKRYEFDVDCDDLHTLVKREQVLGGPSKQDPNDPKYKTFAKESLAHYLSTLGVQQEHKVVQVYHVVSQVVAGTLTKLNFTAMPVNGDYVFNCYSEVWERPWLNLKDIAATCENTRRPNLKNYPKFEGSYKIVPGRETKVDPKDSKFAALAKKSLKQYLASNDLQGKHKVISVDGVTSQLVEGMLYRINFTAAVNGGDAYKCHSKVWEKQWLHSTEITVNCDYPKERHQQNLLPGGVSKQDPKDPKFAALAKKSHKQYLASKNLQGKHKVISVDGVTSQVVAGVLYRINFTAAVDGGDVYKCHSEVWDRPWLQSQEITVNCDYPKERHKHKVMPGGESKEDPKDPKFAALAKKSHKQYLASNDLQGKHKVISVDGVTSQVIEGMLYRINFTAAVDGGDAYKCHSKVWEKQWLHSKEITVNCDYPKGMHKQKIVPGRVSKEDQKDPKFAALAKKSHKQYIASNNLQGNHKVISVDGVTSQIVEGMLYRINFTAAVDGGDAYKCHSIVWEKQWLHSREITVNCDYPKERHKQNSLPGGISKQDPKDPKFAALAKKSHKQYLASKNLQGKHKVISVDGVTSQVVAGVLYRINFTAAVDGGDAYKCHSEVWDRPWLQSQEITVNCDYPKERHKHKVMPGGESKEDPKDPKFAALAKKSHKQYLASNDLQGKHKVISVDGVTSQVVEGMLYRINFTAAVDDGDAYKCHSKVWEKQWLHSKEITVNCDYPKGMHKQKIVPGRVSKEDQKDPKFAALAKKSHKQYIASNNLQGNHKVISVDGVTSQIVEGMLYRINFTAAVDGGDAYKCHSKVWEKQWLHSKEITVNCDYPKEWHKQKSVPGGVFKQDPKDPEFAALAKKSHKQYLASNNLQGKHKVISVDGVTSQVVAGILYRINFTAAVDGGDAYKCHSEVWNRPWLHSQEISVNCDYPKDRHKYKVGPGGVSKENPKDPKFAALAKKSHKQYIASNNLQGKHKVISVDGVTSQVVEGMLYRINFTAAVDGGDAYKCRSEVWERPWLHSKEITVNCDYHKGTHKQKIVPGGVSKEDPKDPKFAALAKKSHKQFIASNNLQGNHKVISVDGVTSQVVEGMLYRINFTAAVDGGDAYKCHSKVWEKQWLHSREITVNCDYPKGTHKQKIVPGGVSKEDPKDPKFAALAKKSHKQYIASNNLQGNHKVISVDVVTSQVVEGMLYRINFTAAVNGGDAYKCHSKVWEKSWLHSQDITVNCDYPEETHKQNIVIGGVSKEDPKDPKFAALAKKSHKQYLASNDLQGKHKVISVDGVTSQVVAGMLYRINFTAAVDDGDAYKCHSKVWERPWLHSQEITVNCDYTQERRKRELVLGGESKKDPKDPKYATLAQEAHKQYLASNNLQGKQKLISVDGVTSQVVAGMLYRINFTAAVDGGDAYKCHSEVWEKQWLHSKEITVNCYPDNRSKRMAEDGGRPENIVNKNLGTPTVTDFTIHQLVLESIDKLDMVSTQGYKQRLAQIRNYTTNINFAKVTTIKFEVGYTTCLKFEIVQNITNCEFLKDVPLRHCVSHIYEKLWTKSAKDIEVSCDDVDIDPKDFKPEAGSVSMLLANEALKHIEAKYPHPRRMAVVKIFSLEKQQIAGIHYRMKIEVGYTNCTAWNTDSKYCNVVQNRGSNTYCRVNVWIQPSSNHPPIFRVQCNDLETVSSNAHKAQARELFNEFIETFSPWYKNDSIERKKRYLIFKENIQKVVELNTHERGTAVYGMTRFSDLTHEEFRSKYLGLNPSLRNRNNIPMRQAAIPDVGVPASFDWRDKGAVTEVKNQGSCGSCWAFSVTGNIEGQWKLHTGQLVSLSEQELVDCDKLDQGCNGGLPDNAYRAIEQLGGLELESDYPYEGEGEKCGFNKTMARVQISGAVNITTNETDMAKWLVEHGPISIGINANAMQFYVGGVSHPWRVLCDPKNLDHGVLIVGYGTKDYPLFHKHLPYWIVKNSWGPMWGEQGYYRVYRGDGTCGVNQMASSAVIDKSSLP